MAKQSPKDPKFRCNICKEYYFAPEHMEHYQCPKHGYLCQKHIGVQGQFVYGHDDRNNPNEENENELDPNKDPYFDKIIEIPSMFIGKCLCAKEDNYFSPLLYDYNLVPERFRIQYLTIEDSLENDVQHRCLKNPAKYVWNDNLKRWLEEGKEKEVDFLKLEKIKTISKSNNSEIKLLLDLFEKNVLTKDQFLEQIKQKI